MASLTTNNEPVALKNAPVDHGFKGETGIHIIFNPTFADLCEPTIKIPHNIHNLKGIHGLNSYKEWKDLTKKYKRKNGWDEYWYLHDKNKSNDSDSDSSSDSDSDSSSDSEDENLTAKCYADGTEDWAQWSRSVNSIMNTEDSEGKNLCADVLPNEDFFQHTRMLEKAQLIILSVDEGNKINGFACLSDLRNSVEERLEDMGSDEGHGFGEKFLYIDGLCSNVRGMGKILMGIVDNIVENSQTCKGLKLAFSYVIKYYQKRDIF